MACEYVCDGCGKREKAIHNGQQWIKPRDWFARSDADGPQDACSRQCIETVAAKTGKTAVVWPL